jgi:hypothetical protein
MTSLARVATIAFDRQTNFVYAANKYKNSFLMMQILWNLTRHFEDAWEKHQISAARAFNCLKFLKKQFVKISDLTEWASSSKSKNDSKIRKANIETGVSATTTKCDDADVEYSVKKARLSAENSQSILCGNDLESSDGLVTWYDALKSTEVSALRLKSDYVEGHHQPLIKVGSSLLLS